jgi:hypothetical protein
MFVLLTPGVELFLPLKVYFDDLKDFFTSTYPQYSMYLYMMMAIPMAIAANNTDVMSIIERHRPNPTNDKTLWRKEVDVN